MEHLILIAADNIETLRVCDVYRVLDHNIDELTNLANYITNARPDLAGEVAECVADIKAE